MKHFLMTDGTATLREARMLRNTLQPLGSPESLPPMEQPQGVTRIDVPANQLPEEVLQGIAERLAGVQKQTNETAASHIETVAATIQRDLDAIASSPNVSKQFLNKYLDSANLQLHPQGLHVTTVNKRVLITPYNPKLSAPDVVARKNRILELQKQISQVDRNIRELMRDFRQNATRYRGQKRATMHRYNVTPEINRFLMQFPQASMQASANPLHQLHALKFQLQQELAGVKSGMIKVAVPGEGSYQNPSLIDRPRFAGAPPDGTRFDFTGAPGGIGPDGLPIPNAMPTAAEQAQILRYTGRWKNAKTEQERKTAEGFLMMEGVDVEGSNFENDEIVMVSPEEKPVQFLVGLVTVLRAFIDRTNRKRTEIEDADVTEKDPSEMSPEERDVEKEDNDKKIADLKEKRTKTEKDYEGAKRTSEQDIKRSDEEDEKLLKEMNDLAKELKKIDTEIKKLEDRNAVLVDPSKFTKKETSDETGLVTQDKLGDDAVLKDFQRLKGEAKQKMRAAMEHILTAGGVQKNMARVGTALGIDLTDIGWETRTKDMTQELFTFIDKFFDNTALEKNGADKYRIAMDPIQTLNDIKGITFLADAELTAEDLPKIATRLNKGGLEATLSGGKIITPFMDGNMLLEQAFNATKSAE